MFNGPAASSGVIPQNNAIAKPTAKLPLLKFPRIVPDQRSKFLNDELFRELSVDRPIYYTGHRNQAPQQRQLTFYNDCRQGKTSIAFTKIGTNLELVLNTDDGPSTQERDCDFNKELGKVHIKSHFIFNGVCVKFSGRLDLESLDGTGRIEYDEQGAMHEISKLYEQYEQFHYTRQLLAKRTLLQK